MFTNHSRFGVLCAVLLGSAALVLPAVANAGALLKATSAKETAAAEKKLKKDKTIKRRRLVDMDVAELSRQILPRASSKSANRVEVSQGLDGEVSLQLFGNTKVNLKRASVEAAFGGGVVWTAAGDNGGTGILVVNNGSVTGYIEDGKRTFLIEPTGRGSLHRVRDVDADKYKNDKHMEIPGGDARKRPTKPPGGGGSGGGGTIVTPPPPGTILEANILGTYTARAFSLLGGVPADKIALDVAIVNTGFKNSTVPLHLNLVGVTAVSSNYDERASSDYAQPLYDLTSGTGYNFPVIREQRNALAADFVTMYADRSEYCGIAWIGPSPSYAFSAINPACNGSATLAHELGHNMGLRHDRYVEAAASADVYNYGYVSTQAKVRDIMSYNNQCSALGISCQRVTYFSSPLINYNGYPLGIPKGTTGAADATRKLGENATAVSSFR